jgi:hypothetical protein
VSYIDGRKVNYRGKKTWIGLVQGDDVKSGHVRVLWSTPKVQTGIHKIIDLVVLDAPPTQEELAKLAEPPQGFRQS